MPLRDYGGAGWPGPYSSAPVSYGESAPPAPAGSGRPADSGYSPVDPGPGPKTAGETPGRVPNCANPPNCTYQAPVVAAGTSIKPSEMGKAAVVRPGVATGTKVSPVMKVDKAVAPNLARKARQPDLRQIKPGY
ncbi:hypothetical protein [Pseudoduganella sp. HUAS MS19]